jgi:hypothetical protein
MRYEDRFRAVTIIRRRVDDQVKPWGNGIFLEFEGKLYLVTCRHMVRSDLPVCDGKFDLPKDLVLRLKTRTTDAFENYEVDILNPRRWRTTKSIKDLADIVVVELPSDLQLKFDIVPWKSADLTTETPEGTPVFIQTLQDGGRDPAYYDVSGSMGTLQDESQAIIDNAGASITHGNSGSLVYRFLKPTILESITDADIQAVGIIAGAKKFGGSLPEMVLLNRAVPILTSWEDYLDESGIEIINFD